MRNKVQLITYVDRLGKGDFNTFNKVLNGPLKDLLGGVHLLPFYTPIDGSDAGFDPNDHTQVDPRLGEWSDVTALSNEHDLVVDLIVNHVSSDSPMFQDVLDKGQESAYYDLFLRYGSVFPAGATEEQLTEIYRPRPGIPFTTYRLKDGSQKMFWTTFTAQQLDIDVYSNAGQNYLVRILDQFQEAGVKLIRLDAVGYAIKKAGTRCFMLPETFEFIDHLSEKCRSRGMEVLVEIHAYYRTQIEIARHVDRVYDFALPPLVLYTLFASDVDPLHRWLEIAPRNCINVLDTHDGIGVIDVGPDGDKPGLLDEQQIDQLVETIHARTNGNSQHATGAAARNVDLYQVNSTYYDALGQDDRDYLIARAIQFFAPGVPQIYYVGLLAGVNDMELLGTTLVGRDINRHYYDEADVEQQVKRPVVQGLFEMIRFRNSNDAFNGDFYLERPSQHQLTLAWKHADCTAKLYVDVKSKDFTISWSTGEESGVKSLSEFLGLGGK